MSEPLPLLTSYGVLGSAVSFPSGVPRILYLVLFRTCKSHQNNAVELNNGSLYLSVTPKFCTEVLHQSLNRTAELWCKTLSRRLGLKSIWLYTQLKALS